MTPPYEGLTRADVLAAFQELDAKGYLGQITAEQMTILFCAELLKRHTGHVVDQISWGYQ
jgi:hypothetical protein